MRRDFPLPPEDVSYLKSLELPWETVKEGGKLWLLVHKWPVPEGYNERAVSVALLIEASYPDVQIDMAYFHPALALANGPAIRALANQSIDKKIWQRWSRHRTKANSWRPGLDGIGTHLTQVNHWLERELTKEAA